MVHGFGWGMEKGVKRWLLNISKWDPSPQDLLLAMSLVPQQEHSSITRYVKLEDRKRALVSRLLQYSLVHEVMRIPTDEIIIKRTTEGKPYLANNQVILEYPNFNFNVSHEGDYVTIASEPLCLVGLDIVYCLPMIENEMILEFIQNFSSYFSAFEWSRIRSSSSCHEMLNTFYRYWCLKESFVKAIGTGVGIRLERVEFHHTKWKNISVNVNGKELKDWVFWIFELYNGHWVSVAKGHPRDAADNYGRTLKRVEFDEEEYRAGLHLPNVNFELRTVEQLIQSLS